MVERRLDDHRARIGHQPVRRLHPVEAAVRAWDADRSSLVSPDGDVDDAAGDERRRARRRTARRVAVPPRVVGLAESVGVAAPRIAEVLAVRLPEDGGASVEHAVDDRGVELGYVAGEGRRSVHHGDTGDGDVVLHGDGAAGQRSCVGAANFGLPIPRVERVVLRCGAMARRSRVAHGRELVGHGVERLVVRAERGSDLVGEEAGSLGIEVDPERRSQRLQAIGAGCVRHLGSLAVLRGTRAGTRSTSGCRARDARTAASDRTPDTAPDVSRGCIRASPAPPERRRTGSRGPR